MRAEGSADTSIEGMVAGALPARGDVLLIVPPVASLKQPLLGPALLQAIGRRAGFRIHLLYANAIFAHVIGRHTYRALARMANHSLLGERVFSSAAYGLPLLGHAADRLRASFEERIAEHETEIEWSDYVRAAEAAEAWADGVAAAVTRLDYAIIGCATMFEQTSASVALLKRIKRLRPEIVTILGGANCEDEMAEGIRALCADADYIFSGESDRTFPAFLSQVLSGRLPQGPLIVGSPVSELDPLPTPSYVDYFSQLERLFPHSSENRTLWNGIHLPLESSRGCWWGQKHHCTFCGLNGTGMAYRKKSPDRVLEQLQQLALEYPADADTMKVSMTDNIMPYEYFRTLAPRLRNGARRTTIFYEQKANLSLEDLLTLKDAGIDVIQAGIETLSTSYAKRMRKGVTASHNVTLLRHAASARIQMKWNLLTHFPADQVEELRQMLGLIPLLRHLPPPDGVFRLSIDRFSPYFTHPDEHGVRNVRPLPAYAEVFPRGVPLSKLAYYFEADYDCDSRRHPELFTALKDEVRRWRAAWRPDRHAPPLLSVERTSGPYREATGKNFILIDTRGLPGTQALWMLDDDEAFLLLVPRRLNRSAPIQWALEAKLGVVLDECFVPLATAEPGLLLDLEREVRPERGPALHTWEGSPREAPRA